MRRKILLILAVFGAFAIIASACGDDGGSGSNVVGNTPTTAASAEVQTISLTARCKGSEKEAGRCQNLADAVASTNAELEAAGDNRRVSLNPIQDDLDWGEYKTEFELASQAGDAPDIIVSGHEHIGDWATAGLIIDITDEIGKYSQLGDVINSLWNATELNGRRWGVPQDAEARPLFYSKILLKQLGWTDAEIDGLADRINSGDFTLQDMLATAKEAVDAGVIAKGDGWFHRPANGPDFLEFYYGAGGEIVDPASDALVFDKAAALKTYSFFEEAVNDGVLRSDKLDGDWDYHKQYTSDFTKVMFVSEGTWRWADWADWAGNFVTELGGEQYMFDNVGFALSPANADGTGQPITLTHPLVYMVSSKSENPDLALRVIANATTKELNTPYAITSGHLGVVNAQSTYAPYVEAKFLTAALPLLDSTTFLPNSPFWAQWSEAYYLGLQGVENGDVDAAGAVDLVVQQLENQLGDNVIIK